MTMILTLKSAQKGVFKLQLRTPEGRTEYKDVEPENLFDFIQAYETYCEVNGIKFLFRVDESVKRYCEARLKEMAEYYNKNVCE